MGRSTCSLVLGGCFFLFLAGWIAACESDGVTPNCSDAGECITQAGDAFPPDPDAGTD